MKKKNLYKLVKQSLKEVLQEQRRDRRLGPDDFFVDPQTGELIPKDLAGAAPTGTGVGPQKTPDNKEDQLIFTPNIEINPIDYYSGLGLGDIFDLPDPPIITSTDDFGTFFTIWSVENDTGNCNLVQIYDGWICTDPNNNGSDGGLWQAAINGNNNGFVQNISTCAPHSDIADVNNPTFAEYMNWFNNANLNWQPGFYGPNGTQPFSEDCPTCTYEEADNSFANAHPFPGNPTPPAGLTYSENNSCIFTACNAPGYSNYFCNNFSNLCSNNEPDLTQLVAVNDTGLCEVEGCLDADSIYDPASGLYGLPNNGYICNTPQGTDLCTGGTLNDTYTDNNGGQHNVANQTNDTTLCNPTPAILGCTFPEYSNYSANNNVEDGSCEYNGCLDQFTGGVNNTNWICVAQPSLCDQGIINTEYTVTIVSTTSETGGTFTADYADPDGVCEQGDIFGCLDNTEIVPGVLQFPTYNDVHVQDVTNYPTPQDQNTALCGDAVITGCTDPSANNYHCDDANAATGVYECTGGVIPTLSYFSPNVTAGSPNIAPLVVGDPADFCDYDLDDDGVLDDDEIVGCTDPNADNYDSTATDIGVLGAFTAQNHIDNGCLYIVYGCTDPNSPAYLNPANLTAPQTTTNTTIVNQVSATDTSDPCQLGPGCTDPNADNYVGAAAAPFTTDDGSCLFEGCANEFANNPTTITSTLTQYNNMIANVDNGSCTFEYCNQPGTSNYVCVANPQLCNENGISCGTTPCPLGVPNTEYNSLDNTGASVTVSIAITDTGCAADGCVDPAAENHDPSATTDDGSCIYRYCDELTAFNYASNRPLIPANLINNFNQNSVDNSGAPWLSTDNGDSAVCEFEGCPPGAAQNSPDPNAGPSTEVTLNSGIYYSHPSNTGCQTDPNPTNPDYIPGLNSTGQLDPDNEDCCAIAGCIDDGNLGFAGQQFWQQNGYDIDLGIAAYPGVSANNYNPSATPPGDGSCNYNIGCMDSGAPNYDQTAVVDTDTTQCLPYCKKIKAFQCNPDPDPNGFAPSSFTKHYITIDCAHIDGNTPAVDDEFWNPGGKVFTAPEQLGTPGQTCPTFAVQNYGISPPPFGAVGYPGQILTCGGVGSPQSQPMQGGSAACAGGLEGCTYIFGATGKGNETGTNLQGGSSLWTLHPANTIQTYGGEKDKKPESTQINAVFRIETIEDDFGPNINNLNDWKCGAPPPAASSVAGFLDKDPLKFQNLQRKSDRKINEVEVSKILRKSLTEMFKKKK